MMLHRCVKVELHFPEYIGSIIGFGLLLAF
jgi:hypothetical protein